MQIIDFFLSVGAEIIAGIVVFVIGYGASKIPGYLTQRNLKAFFGPNALNEKFLIVEGFYTRIDEGPDRTFCLKDYKTKPSIRVNGPRNFMGTKSVLSAFYISQELAKYRNIFLEFISDLEALEDLRRTFISIGGPMVNELTLFILDQPNNRFVEYDMLDFEYAPGKNPNIICVKDGNDEVVFQKDGESDFGFILKLENSFSPGNKFFVCAGIGSSGTSGSAWYLANKWKDLHKEFGDKEFLVVTQTLRAGVTATNKVYQLSN